VLVERHLLLSKHIKVIIKLTNLETLYFDVTQYRIIFASENSLSTTLKP
jgi:hypothetical protein